MDLDSPVGLIERIGLPIVCLGACAWYIRYLNDQFRDERKQMAEQEIQNDQQLVELVKASSDALLQMKTALVEQTSAMRELVSRLDAKRGR